VYNGAAALDACLASLARSTFRDYECLVVDDGSTDHSRAVATQHGATVLALERRGGPARARNLGAARAQGDIVVFLDADVRVHADTLGRIEQHFRGHPSTAAVIGSYDDHPADPGFISQYKNLFHHYVHHHSRSDAWTFWAGCGAVRRQVFLDAHGFDESYTRPCIEDIELGFRLRARGARIDLDPTIQVTHLKRWTLWTLLRTDVMDRAVPWVVLMLRTRTMPADLNLGRTHRVSVALVFVMLLLCAATVAQQLSAGAVAALAALPRVPPARAAAVAAVLAGVLVLLNQDLYRFFARRRGVGFAAAAVPLHWLYYGYCGVAVGIGLSVHLWGAIMERGRSRATPVSRQSVP
jgi:GT2 family glycosyltransferase